MYYKKYKFPLQKNHSQRIQKIAINAGLDCPNRDGSKGTGGCIFCNNDAFIPFYSSQEKGIKAQIDSGIKFFSEKYETNKFLAYFQAYTNTNASLERIKKLFDPIVYDNRFLGIVIGTRPDCISDEILKYFKELSYEKYIKIEFGVETFNDESLKFCNRGHTSKESLFAIENTLQFGIPVGIHFILGLPFDDEESLISNASIISNYEIDSIKLHQLQILKNTILEKIYEENPDIVSLYSAQEYVEILVKFLENLNPQIAVERLINEVPPQYLIAPRWGGLRVGDIVSMIEKEFQSRNSYQGIHFNS